MPRAYAPGSNVAAIGIGLRWNGHELHPWNPKRPQDVWHEDEAEPVVWIEHLDNCTSAFSHGSMGF